MIIHYRYDAYNLENHVELEERRFIMVKETPCGCWVAELYKHFGRSEKQRWVSKTSKKRYCYPTKEEAMVSYKIRKNRHIAHLESQLSTARYAVQLNETTNTVKKESNDCFHFI